MEASKPGTVTTQMLQDVLAEIGRHSRTHGGHLRPEQQQICVAILEKAKKLFLSLAKKHMGHDETLLVLNLLKVVLAAKFCTEACDVFTVKSISNICCLYLVKVIAVLSDSSVVDVSIRASYQSAVEFLCISLLESDMRLFTVMVRELAEEIRSGAEKTSIDFTRFKNSLAPFSSGVTVPLSATASGGRSSNVNFAGGLYELVSACAKVGGRLQLSDLSICALTIEKALHGSELSPQNSILDGSRLRAVMELSKAQQFPVHLAQALLQSMFNSNVEDWTAELSQLVADAGDALIIKPLMNGSPEGKITLASSCYLIASSLLGKIRTCSSPALGPVRSMVLQCMGSMIAANPMIATGIDFDFLKTDSAFWNAKDCEGELAELLNRLFGLMPTSVESAVTAINRKLANEGATPRDPKRFRVAKDGEAHFTFSESAVRTMESCASKAVETMEGDNFTLGFCSLVRHLDRLSLGTELRWLVTKCSEQIGNCLNRKFSWPGITICVKTALEVLELDTRKNFPLFSSSVTYLLENSQIVSPDLLMIVMRSKDDRLKGEPIRLKVVQALLTLLPNIDKKACIKRFSSDHALLSQLVLEILHVLRNPKDGELAMITEENRILHGLTLVKDIVTEEGELCLAVAPLVGRVLEAAKKDVWSPTVREALIEVGCLVLRWNVSSDWKFEDKSCALSLLDCLNDFHAHARNAVARNLDCLVGHEEGGQSLGNAALALHYKGAREADNVRDLMNHLEVRLKGEPPGSQMKRTVLIAIGSLGSALKLFRQDCDGLTVGIVQWALNGLTQQWVEGSLNAHTLLDTTVALEQIRRIARNQGFTWNEHSDLSSTTAQVADSSSTFESPGDAIRALFHRVQDELYPRLLQSFMESPERARGKLARFASEVFGDSRKDSAERLVKEMLPVVLPVYVGDFTEFNQNLLVSMVRLMPAEDEIQSLDQLLVSNFKCWVLALVEMVARMNGADKADSSISEKLIRLRKALTGFNLADLVRVGTKAALNKLVYKLISPATLKRDEFAERCLIVLSNPLQGLSTSDAAKPVARFIRNEFMFLMTQLSEEFQDPSKTSSQKSHILLCVRRLLQLMGKDHPIDAFVPKIFPTLSLALQAKETQLAAIRTLAQLVNNMSGDAIKMYLSAFVVALLPCLRDSDEMEMIHQPGPAVSTTSSARSQLTSNQDPQEAAVELITDLIQSDAISESELSEVSELLPDHHRLSNVETYIGKRLGQRPFEARLHTICLLIERDSDDIRVVALDVLRRLLKQHANHLHQHLLTGHVRPVSVLMTSLLKTARAVGAHLDESTSSVARRIGVCCCECLGWLGAIDPSHLDVGRLEAAKSRVASPNTEFALDMGDKKLACWLLSHYLVQALATVSDPTTHMKLGFCTQELLRFLNFDEESFTKEFCGSRKDALNADVLKLFQKTNYKVTERDPIQRQGRGGKTFFGPEISFVSSLGEWFDHLSHRVDNPQSKNIFLPIAVLKQTDTATSMLLFLLPYAVQNVLCSSIPEETNAIRAEVMAILNEAISTQDDLEGMTNSRNMRSDLGRVQMSVQAVFLLLDTLSRWVFTASVLPTNDRMVVRSAGTRKISPYEGSFTEKAPVQSFLDSIPKRFLAEVALKCGSPSRALFYLELHLRNGMSNIITPHAGTNDARPTLPRDDIELLHKIYAAMEQDPDGLRGVVVQRTQLASQHVRMAGSLEPREEPIEEDDYGDMSQPRLMEQIHELEGESRWNEALSCYEEALETLQNNKPNLADENSLHEGQLKCLWKAGHLESLVSVCDGKLVRKPVLRPIVLPYAVDALWRLGKWSELRAVLDAPDNNMFTGARKGSPGGVSGEYSESLAAALLSIVDNRDPKPHLERARLKILELLSAASMESYERAYPLLVRLQIMVEIEAGVGSSKLANDQWWDDRLKITAASPSLRSEILAVRRAVYRLRVDTPSNTNGEILRLETFSWLSLAKTARESGDIAACESALLMLRNNLVSTLSEKERSMAWAGSWRARTERAALLKSRGSLSEALQVLQPETELLEIDPNAPKALAVARAKALLMSTNLLVETGVVHGQAVLERYDKVLKWRPDWVKAKYHLAKYLDYLLQRILDSNRENLTPAKREYKDDLVVRTISAYGDCLTLGTEHLFEVLPRILTLWYSESERAYEDHPETKSLVEGTGADANGAKQQHESAQKKKQTNGSGVKSKSSTATTVSPAGSPTSFLLHQNEAANQVVQSLGQKLPPSLWYSVMPQLVSRLGHPDARAWEITKDILVRILAAFPSRALWHILGVCMSLGVARRTKAEDVLTKFVQKGVAASSQGNASSVAKKYIKIGYTLFQVLIRLSKRDDLAKFSGIVGQGKQFLKEVQQFSTSNNHYGLVVPMQRLLKSAMTSEDDGNSIPLLRGLGDTVETMSSKAKPKKITIIGTDDHHRAFLCKHEQKGDLRKDSRMMEFSGVVNELFERDVQARRRRLRLRTYAVICLSEDSGLIEWVENTQCYRNLVMEIYQRDPTLNPSIQAGREQLGRIQEMNAQESSAVRVQKYRELVLSKFPPAFHKYFLQKFPDPSSWLNARLLFCRSTATWSMVGHIVGLGDRHAENLLLDTTNGEVVHVDFDCLFDKGLTLAKPEIVPFRLTRNMVDAFGVNGLEGTFRGTCEISMGVLRDNKAMLLSVLESFVVDPLVEWGTKRMDHSAEGDAVNHAIEEAKMKQSAQEKFNAIDERLTGIVRDRELEAQRMKQQREQSNGNRLTRRSISKSAAVVVESGQDSFDILPVSTKGQVDRLIREAIDEDKLSRMFGKCFFAVANKMNEVTNMKITSVGWCPFL